MTFFLAIDAGGTSTRATVLNQRGSCLGYGKSGPGNPVSSGFERAIDSISAASAQALSALPLEQRSIKTASLAIAGGTVNSPQEKIYSALKKLTAVESLMIEADLLAMYLSGTYHPDGYALVSGTGAVCARVTNFSLDRVADGLGWLMGDAGSGFWIGHTTMRAVAAALDGRSQNTVMTDALLDRLGITSSTQLLEGRPKQLQELVNAIYGLRPIELASFAPVAFEAAAAGDVVAKELLELAGQQLAQSLAVVRKPDHESDSLPIVLGGSILGSGSPVRNVLERELHRAEIIGVTDGLAGAAALALLRAGIDVDRAIFLEIQQSLAIQRQS